jgi:MFS family permease
MARIADEVRKTFASMHVSRNFRLFFVGQLISVSGSWVNATALAVLVLHLTHSGVALGIASALLFLPVLLFGVLGGTIADRFDKRRILVWSNAAYALLAAIQFGLVATGAVRVWMVFLIAFLNGLVYAIEPPTRQAFYAELVGEEHITNAVSLNSAVFTGTRVLGGAVAGLMIDAAVIVALLAMRVDELHRQGLTGSEPGLVRAGIRYVWTSAELRLPLGVMSLVYLLAFNFNVLLPLHADRTFDGSAKEIGWLFAALGLGAFVGAIAMANRQPRPTLRRLGAFALAFGLFMAVEGVVPTFSTAMLAMVPVGAASMFFAITANSTLQRFTRADMRGRVMALYTTIFLGSTAIGGPLAGWVGERFGAGPGFVASGLVAALAGVWALRADRPVLVGATAEAPDGTRDPVDLSQADRGPRADDRPRGRSATLRRARAG